jgi:CRP-like cAMP-binding protein
MLGASPLFADLDEHLRDEVIDRILGFSREVALESGQALFTSDEAGHRNLYVLLSGRLSVSDKETGAMLTREMLIPSKRATIVGEIAWLLGSRRTADLVARGETTLLQIDGEKLERYLADHPVVGYQVMRNISRFLAQRLGKML